MTGVYLLFSGLVGNAGSKLSYCNRILSPSSLPANNGSMESVIAICEKPGIRSSRKIVMNSAGFIPATNHDKIAQ